MKIRTDFVTNSSSSSFILAFTNEDKIPEELATNFPREYPELLGRIFNDVLEADRLTHEEILSEVEEYLQWIAEYKVREKYEEEHWNNGKYNYRDAYNYIESEQGKAEIQSFIDTTMTKLKTKMDGKDVVVEVEYGDHEYPDLEHDVMPYVAPVIYQISHH